MPLINKTDEKMKAAFVKVKKWIYAISIKNIQNATESRDTAFQTSLWLEYLALSDFQFSMPFNTRYMQLFALILVNMSLDNSNSRVRDLDIHTRSQRDMFLKPVYESFTPQEVKKLYEEIAELNLPRLVSQAPVSKKLNELLNQIPQIPLITNAAFSLLDIYHLNYFLILAEQTKLPAAIIAATRAWVFSKEKNLSEHESSPWPQKYFKITKQSFSSFKNEYEHLLKLLPLALNYEKLLERTKEENNESDNTLSEAVATLTALDLEQGISKLALISVAIWQQIIWYLSLSDKKNLRLVSRFFLKRLMNPPAWQQWLNINNIDDFKLKSMKFSWFRQIYGIYYSPSENISIASLPEEVVALDFSKCENLIHASTNFLFEISASFPKQLRFLKLHFASNIKQALIMHLIQTYPQLLVTFAGNNLLYWACYHGWQEVVNHILLQIVSKEGPYANLDINQGNNSFTHLMIACQQGHREIAELLLQHGAEVNSTAKSGRTALMVTRMYNDKIPIAKLLLKYGADIYQKDEQGNNVINQAKEWDQQEYIDLFQSYQHK